MGRFEIAKNAFKTPEEIFKQPKKSPLKSFGFGDLPDFDGSKKSKFKTYYCPAGTVRRVGIVYKNPAHLFVGTKVHFLNGTWFLCKKENNALCCAINAPLMRVACVLAIYDRGSYRVMPWVFGRKIYQNLNELNNTYDLKFSDFVLKRNSVTGPFMPSWEIQPCSGEASSSLWQSLYKEDVLRLAEPHFNNLKSCIGQDLSDPEIKELIDQPGRTAESFNNSYRRPPEIAVNRPINRTINRSAINSPPTRPNRLDILDQIFNEIDRDENP